VIRHARASEVRLELQQNSETVELLVNDNGVGFNVGEALEGAKDGKSFGLLGMQERAGLAGGYVIVESAKGQGTEVRVHLPLMSSPSATLREQGGAL